jgi:hypothetical protein
MNWKTSILNPPPTSGTWATEEGSMGPKAPPMANDLKSGISGQPPWAATAGEFGLSTTVGVSGCGLYKNEELDGLKI